MSTTESAPSTLCPTEPAAPSNPLDQLCLSSKPLLSLLCLLCVCLLLFPAPHHPLLLYWVAGYCALLASLDLLQQWYSARPLAQRLQPYWRPLYCGLALLTGSAAALGLTSLAPAQPLLGTLLCLLLVAIALAATLAYSVYRPLLAVFSISLLLPVSIYLLLQPGLQQNFWGGAFLALLLFCNLAAYRVEQLCQQITEGKTRNRELRLELQRARAAQHNAQRARLDSVLQPETPQPATSEQNAVTTAQLEKEERRHQLTLKALRSSQERLNQALDASAMGLWDWDLEHNRVFHSRLQALLGYAPEQLQDSAQQYQALIHPADLPGVRRTLAAHLKGRSDLYRTSYRIRHADGHWVWIEDQGRAIAWDNQGKVLRMAGTRRDISYERAYLQQSRLAHTVFQNSNEGIFILNERFCLQSVNRAFCRILQQDENQLLGKRLDQSSRLQAQNPTLLHRIIRDLKRGMSWQGSFNYQRTDGSRVNLWVQMHGVRDPDGLINQYAGVIADQSHIEQTQERLQYLAQYDSLTGLANRAHFNTSLAKMLQQAQRDGAGLSLILIDVDRFKQINTSLGHQQGDHLLRALAKRLLDAQLPCQLLARLSSDEFALVTESGLPPEQLQRLLGRLTQLFSQPLQLAGETVSTSISIGFSQYPEQAHNLQELVSQAGRALHHAKESGGHRCEQFSADLLHNPHQRLRQEQALRRAVEQKELRVHYQPKLNLDENRITGAEALVRWQHPDEGLVSPDQFIGLAEQVGLIAQIGDQVLEQAIAQASHWYQHGHWLAVAVNLSAPQLEQEQLPERLQQLLQRYRLPAELLELELTESQLLADGPRNIALLQKIRALGIKVSIDDFGTGYSSLSYLKKLPVDAVKIDQSFIRDILNDGDDLAISRAIIALAHGLRLKVTAEGVESAGHLQLLRGLGVNQVQGYFVSRPLPANRFAERFLFQQSLPTEGAVNPTSQLG